MIGILVDTTIIKLLVKKIIPKLYPILEDNTEYLGDFIGNNFISRGLNNLFSNGMIDQELSLLIWDYLFLEGNTVLLKSFLAIYTFLSDKIIKGEKSLEYFNELMKNDLKKINKDNDEFLYNLFFKNDKIISSMDFTEFRFNFSLQVADTLEEQNLEHVKTKLRLSYDQNLYNRQFDKLLKCNKKWPYCISDTYFENVTKIVFYNVFQETGNKYIENYFFSKNADKKEEKIEKKDTQDYYKIKIERRPHYCNEIQNEINTKEGNIEKEKEKDEKEEEEESDENNKLNESNISQVLQRVLTNGSFKDVSKDFEQKIDEHYMKIK